MNIAIITGASSGLGHEFAFQMDNIFHNIDEFWLIARRKDKMEELSKMLRTKTRIISMDITKESSLEVLSLLLDEKQPIIRMLINCAGYGMLGSFDESNLYEQTGMVDLNCKSLIEMTHLCIPFMKKNSRIIQLASSAAFVPQEQFAVYAASKSFVLSFSRALKQELKEKEIYVTTVCPGPIETEFFDRAEQHGSTLAVKKIAMVDAPDVVKHALKASYYKKELAIYSVLMKGFYFLTKVVPHRIILLAMKGFR